MVAGQWARWRTLMASIEQNLELTVSGCELQLLAKDGVYLSVAPRAITAVHLAPGGRADVAVRCPAAGSYSLVSRGRRSGRGRDSDAFVKTIASVEVATGSSSSSSPGGSGDGSLQEFSVPRPCYLVDLTHVADNQLNSGFGLDLGRDQEINGKKFKGPDDYITQMAVGTVQQWDVTGAEKRNALCLRFRVCLGWSWGWGSSSVSLQCSARVPPATAVLRSTPLTQTYSPSIPHTCGAT